MTTLKLNDYTFWVINYFENDEYRFSIHDSYVGVINKLFEIAGDNYIKVSKKSFEIIDENFEVITSGEIDYWEILAPKKPKILHVFTKSCEEYTKVIDVCKDYDELFERMIVGNTIKKEKNRYLSIDKIWFSIETINLK